VVKGTVAGEQRGWLRLASGSYRSDRTSEPLLTPSDLRTRASTPGQELTYTCAPPGSGFRIGIDRDEDGWFDRDEIDQGTDPADPASFPPGTTTTTSTIVSATTTSTTAIPYELIRGSLNMRDDNAPPISLRKRRIVFKSRTRGESPSNRIHPPSPGFPNDPRMGGATLTVYNSSPLPGSPTDEVVINLPAGKWLIGPKFLQYRYTDTDPGAPIQKIDLQPDVLIIKGGGPGWPYTLDEPAQGSVAVRLLMGVPTVNLFTVAYCSDLPARQRNGSAARNDRVDRFVGDAKTAPLFCPARKSGGSPSGAFLDAGAGATWDPVAPTDGRCFTYPARRVGESGCE
jgi:hypothetical protein